MYVVSRGPDDRFVGAIDAGTSSSRVLIFRVGDWKIISSYQVDLVSTYPEEGWCQQDPVLILDTVKQAIAGAAGILEENGGATGQVVAFGLTNQRETTVLWDVETGRPLYDAIVWLDARTRYEVKDCVERSGGDPEIFKNKCGLPLSTYPSACKLVWLMHNVPKVRAASKKGTLMFGTVDSWIMYNITHDKVFATDVTNASRTGLMNLHTLQWDEELCRFYGVDGAAKLPEIRSSAEVYGYLDYSSCPFPGVPLSGCLGDQQAALVGQQCFRSGEAKCTYGTGCFLLTNIGEKPLFSKHGLLTTVAYQLGQNAPPVYALEGAISVAGAAIDWLKRVGIIGNVLDSEVEASKVKDNGGVYFVPAFGGLFAPYWRPDARGTMLGLTQHTTKGHLCLATLESIAFQVADILDLMLTDGEEVIKFLCVDGGMMNNNTLVQIQADLLGNIPVNRPKMVETTALGAALAAAHTMGLWELDHPSANTGEMDVFSSRLLPEEKRSRMARWKMAVERSFGWVEQNE